MRRISLKIAVRSIITALILFTVFTSCTHQPVTIKDLDTVCFDTQVLPILQTSCAISGCHGSFSEGFSVTDYNSVMRSVVPGEPKKSRLYRVLVSSFAADRMPPDRPLSAEQRSIIEVWIAQGAKNTTCSQSAPTSTAKDTISNSAGNTNSNPDSICFAQDILPLFESTCATSGCHDAASHREGYILTDYSNIMRGIRAYQPDQSRFYRVTSGYGEDRMPPPPYNALTTDQRSTLKQWIEQGALNSNCTQSGCDTTGTISFATQVAPTLQTYCIGCHSGNFPNGNVNLSGYDNVRNVAATQRNNTSLLIGALRGKSGFYKMPPSSTIDECTIRKIELWIVQGMQNN